MYQNDTHFTEQQKIKNVKAYCLELHATSEVNFSRQDLSWDRGYDSDDIQVWGSVDGPYIFQLVNKNN